MNIRGLAQLVSKENAPFIQRYQRVALCMSGGLDSTALFYVFLEWSKKNYFSELVILHVNYHLRDSESDGDRLFVEQLGAAHGFACQVLNASLSGRNPRESIQVWARRIRHAWFQTFAVEGYQIVLGHHENDLAENILLRIARGTKTANLGGMNVLDGSIWRPLISVSRATIYTAMTTSGHGWREDSSNTKSVYARNRIRQEVIPVLDQIYPGATKRMASWAKNTGSSRPKDLGDAIASTGRLAGARLNDAKITAIADFIQNARLGQSMRISLSQWLICGEPRTRAPVCLSDQENQHRASLDGRDIDLILSSGTTVLISKRALSPQFLELNGLLRERSYNLDITGAVRIAVISGIQKVNIAGLGVAFKFKDLMQKWKIPVIERTQFVSVSSTANSKGLCKLENIFPESKFRLEF